MSLVKWVGIKTARELPECEDLLSMFGYIRTEGDALNKNGYLWVDILERFYLYSTINANSTDVLIEVCELANTLVLVDLGAIE